MWGSILFYKSDKNSFHKNLEIVGLELQMSFGTSTHLQLGSELNTSE
jgi:hypothetical protein